MNLRQFAVLMVASMTIAASAAGPSVAANLPNAAPLQTMERARSYALLNHSSDAIVAAHIHMTNGQVRDLTWQQAVRPGEGRDIAVPSTDCMRSVDVQLKSGRTLTSAGTSGGTPDCRMTHITVTNNDITVGTAATNRPPASD